MWTADPATAAFVCRAPRLSSIFADVGTISTPEQTETATSHGSDAPKQLVNILVKKLRLPTSLKTTVGVSSAVKY